MYITRLILSGYKRFAITNTNHIEIDFTHPRHIILGTNGSGKTSLLDECTPNPGVRNRYYPDGYKKVWFTHRGHSYYGCSDFANGGASYTLTKDDEVLVDAGNLTTYKKVLYDTLQWSDALQSIMYDTTIAELAPSARKSLFTLLHGEGCGEGLEMFAKLLKYQKEANAQLAYISNQITSIETHKLSEKELQEKQSELVTLQDEKAKLETERTPQGYTLVAMDRLLDETTKLIYADEMAYTRLQSSISTQMGVCGMLPDDDADNALMSTTERYNHIKGSSETLSQELEALHEQKTVADKYNQVDVNQLEKEIKLLKNQRLELGSKTTCAHDEQYIIQQLELLSKIKRDAWEAAYEEDMTPLIQEVAEIVKDRQYSIQLSEQLSLLERREKEYAQQDTVVSCPACHHGWTHNPSQEQKQQATMEYQQTLQAYQMLIAKHQGNKKVNDGKVSLVEGYYRLQHALTPYNIPVHRLSDSISQLQYELTQAAHNKSIDKLDYQLLTLENTYLSITNRPAFNEQRYTELENKYTLIVSELRSLNNRIAELNKLVKYKKDINSLNSRLMDNKNKLDTYKAIRLNIINDLYILDKLKVCDTQIIALHTVITKAKSADDLLLKYRQDHLAIDQKAQLAIGFANYISPVDGLLSKGMIDNLNKVLIEANRILEVIWEYPLEFELYDQVDGTELKYLFPMLVNGHHRVEDISNGSSSIREITSFALSMAILRFLGLTDFTLRLDEFGSTMDVIHRMKAYASIYGLYESGFYSQLILVTHHQDVYANITANTTVLCSKNI